MTADETRAVVGFEDLYTVSSNGEVFSRYVGRPLRPGPTAKGYMTVRLHKDGHGATKYVHRLVADAFLGPQPGLHVNHLNGRKRDNHLGNLEWVTALENNHHAISAGLRDPHKKLSKPRKSRLAQAVVSSSNRGSA